MQTSARGIMMAEVPIEVFRDAVLKVVKLNARFVHLMAQVPACTSGLCSSEQALR
jgi:hypothetical protein